jgi:D-sedoheptulose 7-phosphate isomerase
MNLSNYKKCLSELDSEALLDLKSIVHDYDDIVILGNGGSNAISCHMAEDYTKMLDKRVICFGDSARMSCYANDYGWDMAYTKFLEHFAHAYTLVILISSSGKSQNILNAAEYCNKKDIALITLSGFSKDNPLKEVYSKKSLLHFWVDSTDYGIVECMHELILHSIL